MASPKVYVFLRIDYIAFASILVNLPARERPTTKSFAFGPPPYSAKPNRDDRLRVTYIFLPSGIRHPASGIWHLASGFWHLASGIWHLKKDTLTGVFFINHSTGRLFSFLREQAFLALLHRQGLLLR